MVETICFLFLFSLIEFILMYLITNWICIVNYEYVSLKYTRFSFSNSKEDSPTGLNILLKIFFPPAYIVVLSGILYKLDANYLVDKIVFVTVFYYLVKWLICTLLFNRAKLINWGNEFWCFMFSLFLSWGIYEFFISKTEKIFVPLDELRNAIWIAIITFFFGVFIKIIYNQAKLNLFKQKYKVRKYINKQYEKFTKMYDGIVDTDDDMLRNITYAIMIYENYNRPKFIRFFENTKFFVTGHASLGIMQVSTDKYIDDEESVRKGYQIIMDEYYLQHNIKTQELQNYIDQNNEETIINGDSDGGKENKQINEGNEECNQLEISLEDESSTEQDNEIYYMDEEDLKRVVQVYNRGEKYVEEVMYIYSILQGGEQHE